MSYNGKTLNRREKTLNYALKSVDREAFRMRGNSGNLSINNMNRNVMKKIPNVFKSINNNSVIYRVNDGVMFYYKHGLNIDLINTIVLGPKNIILKTIGGREVGKIPKEYFVDEGKVRVSDSAIEYFETGRVYYDGIPGGAKKKRTKSVSVKKINKKK